MAERSPQYYEERYTLKVRLLALASLALTLFAVADASADEPRGLTRGMRWVRSHPFTLMALTITPTTFDVAHYRDGAGLNTMLPWKAKTELFVKAAAEGLPWHYHQRPHHDGLTDELKRQFHQLHDTYPGCTGWMVWDEPQTLYMPKAAKTMEWLREEFPDKLVYSNALPSGAPGMAKYYGSDEFPEAYNYPQYLRDFVTILKTDVVMYDAYIFKEGGKTSNVLPSAVTARRLGLEFGIPYWTFVQSHSDPRRKYRMPSESDIRMQVFLHLTMGFKGIAYFTYENQQGPAMVSPPPPGVINPIFYHVGRLNREVANLGPALRMLTSTDVRVVAGPGHPPPTEVPAWEPGANGISAITINDTGPGNWKHLLVGSFRSDDRREYLMITNLWHDMNKRAADRQVSVTLTLSPGKGIDAVGRLSRETGHPERLAVREGKLDLVLPGGTGELLRLGDADFPGL